jgi:hypothetical protein
MEYTPQFLANWHPQATATPPTEISRAAVLARYRSVLARYRSVLPGPVPAQPLFQDITALDWELPPAQAKWLAGHLALFGLAVTPDPTGYMAQGQAVTFRIATVEQPRQPCLRRVHFALPRPYTHTEHFPGSTLKLSGLSAVWEFEKI